MAVVTCSLSLSIHLKLRLCYNLFIWSILSLNVCEGKLKWPTPSQIYVLHIRDGVTVLTELQEYLLNKNFWCLLQNNSNKVFLSHSDLALRSIRDDIFLYYIICYRGVNMIPSSVFECEILILNDWVWFYDYRKYYFRIDFKQAKKLSSSWLYAFFVIVTWLRYVCIILKNCISFLDLLNKNLL